MNVKYNTHFAFVEFFKPSFFRLFCWQRSRTLTNMFPLFLLLLFSLLFPFNEQLEQTKNRRLADEDDELSEVQPDAVPPEVREWLASTFTRQLATTRKKSDEKPKFRSVAHAIRAGIFVDRIYRRISSTALMQFPPEVVKVLKVNRSSTIFFCCSRGKSED